MRIMGQRLRSGRARQAMAWLLGGWLLLVALGYLVAPSLVRSILTEQLSQALQRQV